MTVTLSFQSSGTIPGAGAPVEMRGPSLTIGRGAENDLVLPDPDRLISKQHCVVENHNGNLVVVDLSTNGTFLNYGKIPLGRTPTPLNDGDVLGLGGYELQVSVREVEAGPGIAAPLDEAAVSPGMADRAPDGWTMHDAPGEAGDFLDDLLGGPGGPTGPRQIDTDDPVDALLPPLDDDGDLLAPRPEVDAGIGASQPQHGAATQDHFSAAAQAPMIPDDWDLAAPSGADATPPPGADAPLPPAADDPFAEPEIDAAPAPAPARATPPPVALAEPGPRPITPDPAAAGTGDQGRAARAFLEALCDGQKVPADADLSDTMARLGRAMRAMVTGLREILMTRTSIKSEFRIDQTMIRSGDNNPLKFSVSPEQAIEVLLRPASKGYLPADAAAAEALNDIKAHEIAMVTGMEAALKGVLKRLDPAVLEARVSGGGGLSGLLSGRKGRSWEAYRQRYAEISDQAETEFNELFSQEFARAYKQQLDRLR